MMQWKIKEEVLMGLKTRNTKNALNRGDFCDSTLLNKRELPLQISKNVQPRHS